MSDEAPPEEISRVRRGGAASGGHLPQPVPSLVSAAHQPRWPISGPIEAMLRQERAGRSRQRDRGAREAVYLEGLQRMEEMVESMRREHEIRIQRLEARMSRESPDECYHFCMSLVPLMQKMTLAQKLEFQLRVTVLLRELLEPSPSPPPEEAATRPYQKG